MDEHPTPNRPRISLPTIGIALALGVGLGAAFAASSHNLALGIGMGVAFFIIWIVFGQANRRTPR